MAARSLLVENRQIQRAIELIGLGARLQVLDELLHRVAVLHGLVLDLLGVVGEVELSRSFCLGELRSLAADGALEESPDPVLEDALARESHAAHVGDHGARLGPDVAVEVDLKHAVVLELEEPLAAVLLGGATDEIDE